MTDDRAVIIREIQAIDPLDEIERDCKTRALDWIAENPLVYRLQVPDVPKKHLVAYFVVMDPATSRLLLVHHNRAQAWLPTGGHIDPQEHPRHTVKRECQEELGVEAVFLHNEAPLFLSEARVTDGDHVHTDVSLWYLLQLAEGTVLKIEEGKFGDVKWWGLEDILSIPPKELGPDLNRFMRKLRYLLHTEQAA